MRPGARQQGAILVISMIFIVILTLIGIASLNRTELEESMAANFQERNRAFQAAESIIAQVLAQVQGGNATQFNTEQDPSPSTTTLGSLGASAQLQASYIAKTAPGPTDRGWGVSCCEFHYFNLDSVGTANKGATVNVNRGVRIIGAKDDTVTAD